MDAYHHGNLREALVDAALASLDSGGGIPSLRQLASLVGVSRNAPYRHFQSKEDLLGHVAVHCFEALCVAIATASDLRQEPVERAHAGCRAYIDYGVRHPSRYGLMFGSNTPVTTHSAATEASYAAFALLVEAAAAFEPLDARLRAFHAWLTLHGAVDLLRQGVVPADLVGDVDAHSAHAAAVAVGTLRALPSGHSRG